VREPNNEIIPSKEFKMSIKKSDFEWNIK